MYGIQQSEYTAPDSLTDIMIDGQVSDESAKLTLFKCYWITMFNNQTR